MKFITKTYEIHSDKVKDNAISVVLISDLHLAEYGDGNRELIREIRRIQPDLIVSSGDIVTAKPNHDTKVAEELLKTLAEEYPVYYAMGNHEERLKKREDLYGDMFTKYVNRLIEFGVKLLCNEHEVISIGNTAICIHGLQLPLSYYQRMCRISLEQEVMTKFLGEADSEYYNILLAHHPRYADSYFDWGADLTLCGHVHGGVMRLGNQACISPDLSIFPRYGYGRFDRGSQCVIVSGGLGEHSIPFRILNPKELIHLVIK